jgi:hypothetical protein
MGSPTRGTDRNTVTRSAPPKIMESADVLRCDATRAPQTAPTVVAVQRNIPTLIFEMPSRRYAAAAPLDVAMTEHSAAPIA